MQLDKENTLKTLTEFSKYVVKQSRTNLTKGGKNVSKQLYDSIGYDLNISANSFELGFKMQDYGQFQDLGVRGKTSSSRAPRSPFKFGTGSGAKGGLTNGIDNWVKRKRIQFTNRKTGKFMSYDTTAYLIRNSIYNKGMKPTMFFSKPFEAGFINLPDDVIKAYGLDVENFLKYTLK
jgi:hypothetical protein